MEIPDVYNFVRAAVYAVLAVLYVRFWVRRGFWLPRYIHVLAFIAFLLGLVTIFSLQQQGLGKPALTSFLIVFMFPTIVYAVFVLFGGVAAAPKLKKRRRIGRNQ